MPKKFVMCLHLQTRSEELIVPIKYIVDMEQCKHITSSHYDSVDK